MEEMLVEIATGIAIALLLVFGPAMLGPRRRGL